MENTKKVSDQIYPASIDMRTGHLDINKNKKYTISEVFKISTDLFGMQNRYKTTDGYIFGDMSCVLCRTVDKKKLVEESAMMAALDNLLTGVSILKTMAPADAPDETKWHIKNLESETAGLIESFRKNYNTKI